MNIMPIAASVPFHALSVADPSRARKDATGIRCDRARALVLLCLCCSCMVASLSCRPFSWLLDTTVELRWRSGTSGGNCASKKKHRVEIFLFTSFGYHTVGIRRLEHKDASQSPHSARNERLLQIRLSSSIHTTFASWCAVYDVKI